MHISAMAKGRHDVFATEILDHSCCPVAVVKIRGAPAPAFCGTAQRAQSRRADLGARRRNGRWFQIADGRVRSGRPACQARHHARFKNAALGAKLLTPPINWLEQINAQKDFKLGVDGPEDLTNWFAQTMMMIQTVRWKIRHRHAGRHDALLQHDQWRPGLRLCQGRQDRPHHAHRFRRRPIRSPGRSRRAA